MSSGPANPSPTPPPKQPPAAITRCVLWCAPGTTPPAELVSSLARRDVLLVECDDAFAVLAQACEMHRADARRSASGAPARPTPLIVVFVRPRTLDGAADVAAMLARYAPRAACWWFDDAMHPKLRPLVPADAASWSAPAPGTPTLRGGSSASASGGLGLPTGVAPSPSPPPPLPRQPVVIDIGMGLAGPGINPNVRIERVERDHTQQELRFARKPVAEPGQDATGVRGGDRPGLRLVWDGERQPGVESSPPTLPTAAVHFNVAPPPNQSPAQQPPARPTSALSAEELAMLLEPPTRGGSNGNGSHRDQNWGHNGGHNGGKP